MPSRSNNSTLPVLETDKQLMNYLSANLTESIKQFIRVAIKTMVKEEMVRYKQEVSALIGSLHFNGYYPRHLQSTFGEVRDIPIPRFRDNPAEFNPRSLGVFEGKREELEHLIASMHLAGISQRKVERLMKGVYGVKVSKDRVGLIHRQLAEAEETQINHRPITESYAYLMLDGIWGKAKGYGWEDNKAVILCVLGITAEGKRQVLGFKVARSESYDEWAKVVVNLKERGLTAKNIELLVTDDADGLTSALEHLLPDIPIQHCMVHKMRNVLGKTSHKHKPALAEDLKSIYREKDKKSATQKAIAVTKKWYVKEPKACSSLKHHFKYTLTYLDLPQEVGYRYRTTNILERELREVRRRIKVFDSTFNDTGSMSRYANSIFNNLNQNYPAVQNPKLHNDA
jgi:putative transposase